MTKSILTTVKKLLGFDDEYTEFDLDIITHINSTLVTLNQIGIGPEDPIVLLDKTTEWDELTQGDNKLNSVKTYIGIKVRLVFDPPSSSTTAAALEASAKEIETRLYMYVDNLTPFPGS